MSDPDTAGPRDDPAAPGPEKGPTPGHEAVFARRLSVLALGLLVVALSVHLLHEFSDILQQLLVAIFIAYLIVPAYHWLVRRGHSHFLAGVILLAGILGVSFGFGRILYRGLGEIGSDKVALYQRNLEALAREAVRRIPGLKEDQIRRAIADRRHLLQGNFQAIRIALGTFLGFLEQAVIVLIYLGFLLAEQASFPRRIAAAFGPDRARRIMAVVDRINASIVEYLAVKTFVSALVGASTTAILLAFGVDGAVFWGIVAFFTNYVPYIGSLIGVSLPVVLSLLQHAQPWRTLAIFVLLEVAHQVIGFVIEPRMAGDRLDLSPLVVILALAFGWSIWGTVGMILAVPLAAVLKIILENIEETRPIATLMSNF